MSIPRPSRRVFISSAVYGLEPYRLAVRDAIGRLGLVPLNMEQMGARPHGPVGASLKELQTADYYLGIVAWRYGTIQPDQTLAITHREYREAVRLNKPRLIFLAEPATETRYDLFPLETRDQDHEQALKAFRAELEADNVRALFTSVDNLFALVTTALVNELDLRDAPHQVPARVPGFVGREGELALLMDRLRHKTCVSLNPSITGMGGIGKSTLAAEAMNRLAEEKPLPFFNSFVTVNAREKEAIPGYLFVLDRLLDAWKITLNPKEAGTSDDALAVTARETAIQRIQLFGETLVLLDNVEENLPIVPLLDLLASKGMAVLLTSRYVLISPRLQQTPLDILDPDAAIQLFAERFHGHGAAWNEATDGAATLELVNYLGRLPLAIELAAARAALRHETPQQVAEEMRQPRLLERLKVARESVRYTLEKSLGSLTAGQQSRFAALALLDGPDWPRHVVEALFAAIPAASTAEDDLDQFVRFSLVALHSRDASNGTRLTRRVRMHPLLRELARERWQNQDAAPREQALAGLLTALLALVQQFKGDFATLEGEEELLTGTVRRAGQEEVAPQTLRDLTEKWNAYLWIGGHWRLWQAILPLRLQACRQLGDRRGEADALNDLGRLATFQGRFADAEDFYRQSLAIFLGLADRAGEANTRLMQGTLESDRDRYPEAEEYYRQALMIFRELRDQQGEGATLLKLGTLAGQRGVDGEQEQYEVARDYFHQARAVFHELSDLRGEGNVLMDIGSLSYAANNLVEADESYRASLKIFIELLDRHGEGLARNNVGNIARELHRFDEAEQFYQQALTIYRALNDRHHEADTIYNLGLNAEDQALYDDARKYFNQALVMYEELGLAGDAQYTRDWLEKMAKKQAEAHAAEPPSPPDAASHRETNTRPRRWRIFSWRRKGSPPM